MPTAEAMSRVLVPSKPRRRNSRAAAFKISCRRLPSSRSSSVLRGRPRGRLGGTIKEEARAAHIGSYFYKAVALHKGYTALGESEQRKHRMSEAFIYDAVRTPRGKGKADGSLHGVKPVNLLAGVLAELQRRSGFETGEGDDVGRGCV